MNRTWIAATAMAALLWSQPARAVELSRLSNEQLDGQLRRAHAELARINAEKARRGGAKPTAVAAPTPSPTPVRTAGAARSDPYGDPTLGTNEALAAANASRIQDLYIRSDPLDAFTYLFPLALSDGKGASLSFSSNEITRSQSLNANAFSSYVLARDFIGPDFGYALAPFVYANGSLTNPQRAASERNALQAGADIQFRFGGIMPDVVQTLGFRPYYQTDFRGDGSIYGVSALYEVTKASINLGARAIEPGAPSVLSAYFRLLPEFNYFRVEEAGRMAYRADRDYAYLGGTVQLRSVLFENLGPSWLANRLYVNGSVTQFWDLAAKGRGLHDAEIEGGYIIGNNVPVEGLGRLTTSVSVLYNNGISRLTNERRDQYRVQLNVRY